jgi:FtsP/CotA-like multicopper oxidase with cupredoxin domain
MSNAQRLIVLVGALLVLGVGFVLLSAGGDEGDESAGTTATAPATTSDGPAPTTTRAAPAPAVTTIRVRDGEPVGGVRTIKARRGDRVRIVVTSPDTTDEVHLHGYDIARDLKAGGRVRFSFTADAEGIFEIELEGSHTQIAKLEVRPRQ